MVVLMVVVMVNNSNMSVRFSSHQVCVWILAPPTLTIPFMHIQSDFAPFAFIAMVSLLWGDAQATVSKSRP